MVKSNIAKDLQEEFNFLPKAQTLDKSKEILFEYKQMLFEQYQSNLPDFSNFLRLYNDSIKIDNNPSNFLSADERFAVSVSDTLYSIFGKYKWKMTLEILQVIDVCFSEKPWNVDKVRYLGKNYSYHEN